MPLSAGRSSYTGIAAAALPAAGPPGRSCSKHSIKTAAAAAAAAAITTYVVVIVGEGGKGKKKKKSYFPMNGYKPVWGPKLRARQFKEREIHKKTELNKNDPARFATQREESCF